MPPRGIFFRRPAARCVAPALILIAALHAPPARAQRGGEVNRHYPVTDPRNFTLVVATVGGSAITAQEFLLSYEFGPAFAKREKDSRARYLDFMVDEKLLALDARARGLAQSDRVRRSLRVLEGDMATEELYRDDILSSVRVSPREIARGVRDEQVHYALRWLFAGGEDGGASLASALKSGTPFDTLLAREIRAGAKMDDRSMETTLFRLRRTSPLLAAVAETLGTGRNSAPVRGPDGWYVLRVTRAWRDVTLSESESANLAADARSALTQQKADSLSDRYVRAMMLAHNPVIMRTTFDLLEGWLAGIWVRPERYSSWELASRVETLHGNDIDRHGGDTLVALAHGAVSLGEFLAWYRARDTYFSLARDDERSFFLSVENLVWRMVRDRLLVARALARNLEDRDRVKKQLGWWEDKILFGEEKLFLGSTIPLSDSAFRAYYNENVRDYRADSGGVQPYERVKDQVRKDYYTFELKKNMLHRIIALKRTYPVEVHEDVLKSLPVDVENDPRAIDVYIGKTGGTFPHPAFPVIDFDWQTWM